MSPCEAQSCPAAAARLFILAAPVWDGFPSLLAVQLPASGGEHAHQPFIEACLLLGKLPFAKMTGGGDRDRSPKRVKTTRSKIRKNKQ